MLDQVEYNLLVNWCFNKWDIKKTAELLCYTKKECEEEINKVIDKLIPILWSYKNNPFITDIDRKICMSKNKWIGDKIIDGFLETDLMIIPVEEYINTFRESRKA